MNRAQAKIEADALLGLPKLLDEMHVTGDVVHLRDFGGVKYSPYRVVKKLKYPPGRKSKFFPQCWFVVRRLK